MREWFALVILVGDPTGLVPVTRHASQEACERQLAVEVLHHAATGRAVAHATCDAVRIPRLRPVTGEVLR